MKIDLFNFIQLTIMLLCLITYIHYAIYTLKNNYKVNIKLCYTNKLKFIRYLRKLCKKDYDAFEKYGIWRFYIIYKF